MFDYAGEYTEVVVPGAFRITLTESPDVSLLIDHQGLPLANTKAGTMELAESERGLDVVARLDPANPMSKQVISGVTRGDIKEMSFSFRAVLQDWNEDYTYRRLTQLNLHRGDVSVVDRLSLIHI